MNVRLGEAPSGGRYAQILSPTDATRPWSMLRAGSGCDMGNGAQGAVAPVTPGLTCSWNTEFEPTADTVSEMERSTV